MKLAMFWHMEGKNVKCELCPHNCIISDGHTGVCGVRKNVEGKLFSLVYEKIASMAIDPIEKKPLFHFFPGSYAFSIGTVGCNMNCRWFQNYDISQFSKEHKRVIGKEISPEDIVGRAKVAGCEVIAYTYNEPTIFYEMVYETSKIARKEGLKNVWVTNGYITKEAFEKVAPLIDAMNIDLKSFSEKTYQNFCGAKLKPVLDIIKKAYKHKIWLEVTTLVIPKINDSAQELKKIAKFIASVDKSIPWHVTAFHPAYKMLDKSLTPLSTLEKAKRIGEYTGLKYIYIGNIAREENTYCPRCKKLLVRRMYFNILENNIIEEKCSYCGEKICGVFE